MAPSIAATSAPGAETATSMPHAWLNSHSLRASLTRATTLDTPNSVLASSAAARFDLVVSGRGDHHIARLHPASSSEASSHASASNQSAPGTVCGS